MFYVNEYLLNRAYGGPEEGGWWYDTGDFVKCHGVYRMEITADIRINSLQSYLQKERKGQRSTSSMACTGFTDIWVDDFPGQDFPNGRPHYE